jgi:hypothetical protein
MRNYNLKSIARRKGSQKSGVHEQIRAHGESISNGFMVYQDDDTSCLGAFLLILDLFLIQVCRYRESPSDSVNRSPRTWRPARWGHSKARPRLSEQPDDCSEGTRPAHADKRVTRVRGWITISSSKCSVSSSIGIKSWDWQWGQIVGAGT